MTEQNIIYYNYINDSIIDETDSTVFPKDKLKSNEPSNFIPFFKIMSFVESLLKKGEDDCFNEFFNIFVENFEGEKEVYK